mgnify:CR=1 FL=1
MRKEKAVLYSQSYLKFYMNPLLKLTIFSSPSFSNLEAYEIPYRTKKEVVVHVFSHRRIAELFTFGGLDASTKIKDEMKYKMCGKVNLNKGGKNAIGYIVDEDKEKEEKEKKEKEKEEERRKRRMRAYVKK